MEEVRVAEKRLSDYRAIIGGPAFAEILALASKLKGKRVAHVNATGYGGGGARPLPPPPPPPPGGRPPVGRVVLPRVRHAFHPTQGEHAPPTAKFPRISVNPPGIDRTSPKNRHVYREELETILPRFDVDFGRPVITQVGRFDPWKDPLGVIDAYRLVKKKIPKVQLLLVASMARDDPAGGLWVERSARHAGGDPDIHFLTDLRGGGGLEGDVLQRQTHLSLP